MTPRPLRLGFTSVLLAMLCLARSGSAGEPRWLPLGPPAVPLAARLVVEPGNGDRGGRGNRAFALNDTGLWFSGDGVRSWRSLQPGLGQAPRSVTFDPFHPGRIYAVVTESDAAGALYRSDDFGARWTAVSRNGETYSFDPQQIGADPFTRDTLFWILDFRLYRSRDAGRTWDCVLVADGAASCAGNRVSMLAFAPDRPGTLYASGSSGFFVTHDGGRTWSQPPSFVGETDVLVATREPRTLYSWSHNPFYRGDVGPCFGRSDDEGVTWRAVLRNTLCGEPAIDPADPRAVRLVVLDGGVPRLWRSRDGGVSWSTVGTVPALGDLYALPGGGFVLATDKGFFQAPAEQGPWQPANRGFAASEIGAVLPVGLPAGKTILAAPVASLDDSAPSLPLLLTEDGGRSWTGEPLINPRALAADPADPRHLLASSLRYGSRGSRYARILESRDGGHTWQGAVDPQASRPFAITLAIDPFEPRTLYAGTLQGFSRSDDGGLTWRESSAGLPHPHCNKYFCTETPVSTLLADPDRAGRIFIRILDQGFVSQNRGVTWTQLRTHDGPDAKAVHALAFDSEGALIVVGGGPRGNGEPHLGVVYRSTDGGATWTRLGRLPGTSDEFTGLAAAQGALWVSSQLRGVQRSTDGGRTWKPANTGLPLLFVKSLVTDPEDPARLYATIPGNGIYTLAAP